MILDNNLKQINVFVVGVGNVGGTLLDQIYKQQNYLREHLQIELRVIAIANSKKMLFDQSVISLDNWKPKLQQEGEDFNLEAFVERVKQLGLKNSVFVDNTANSSVASVYNLFLSEGISVVTCNKIANSDRQEKYFELKKLAQNNNCKFNYETNVGASIPVIQTIKDLVNTGDKVLSIQAILSGSLTFIFNNYSGETSFCDIVRQAKEDGYTEPDPREDLGGSDVVRKVLILTRESGHQLEYEQVQNDSFLPGGAMEAPSIEAFFDILQDNESYFKTLLHEAQKKGAKLKAVGSIDEHGKGFFGLKHIMPDSPMYHVEGKDNILVIKTERYHDQPLVIKGAGAGGEVTASGVFADILKTTIRF